MATQNVGTESVGPDWTKLQGYLPVGTLAQQQFQAQQLSDMLQQMQLHGGENIRTPGALWSKLAADALLTIAANRSQGQLATATSSALKAKGDQDLADLKKLLPGGGTTPAPTDATATPATDATPAAAGAPSIPAPIIPINPLGATSAADTNKAILQIEREKGPNRTAADAAAQRGVADVMANRVATSGGKTLGDILAQPGQFENRGNAVGQPGSGDYERTRANVLANLLGLAPDTTQGSTMMFSPSGQAALGRGTPAWAQGKPQIPMGGNNMVPGVAFPGQVGTPDRQLPQLAQGPFGPIPAAASGVPGGQMAAAGPPAGAAGPVTPPPPPQPGPGAGGPAAPYATPHASVVTPEAIAAIQSMRDGSLQGEIAAHQAKQALMLEAAKAAALPPNYGYDQNGRPTQLVKDQLVQTFPSGQQEWIINGERKILNPGDIAPPEPGRGLGSDDKGTFSYPIRQGAQPVPGQTAPPAAAAGGATAVTQPHQVDQTAKDASVIAARTPADVQRIKEDRAKLAATTPIANARQAAEAYTNAVGQLKLNTGLSGLAAKEQMARVLTNTVVRLQQLKAQDEVISPLLRAQAELNKWSGVGPPDQIRNQVRDILYEAAHAAWANGNDTLNKERDWAITQPGVAKSDYDGLMPDEPQKIDITPPKPAAAKPAGPWKPPPGVHIEPAD